MTRPTMPAVSAEAQAVLDAAQACAARIAGVDDAQRFPDELVLLAAVAAYAPLEAAPSPVLPPEPASGAVLARRDSGDEVYQRIDSDEFSELHRWYMAGEEDPRTWEHVCAGSEVVVLRPVSEVVDRADAQELAEALRPFAARVCSCFDQPCIHEAVRTALARYDAPGVTA